MTSLPLSIQRQGQENKKFKLKLSENPWPCDCSILNFKMFLIEQKTQVLDMDEIKCIFSNKSMSSEISMKMSYFDLCAFFQNKSYIIIIVVSFVVIIISISDFVFYYRHKLHVLSILNMHCNACYIFLYGQRIEDDKLYDAFISYGSADREVALAILEQLEQKPPYFNFCLHQRNWAPGYFITSNIINSVRNSRKTLIILSETFVKSEWFHIQFQAAFHQALEDKKDRLVMVVKGKLPNMAELEQDAQYTLFSETYLRWGREMVLGKTPKCSP